MSYLKLNNRWNISRKNIMFLIIFLTITIFVFSGFLMAKANTINKLEAENNDLKIGLTKQYGDTDGVTKKRLEAWQESQRKFARLAQERKEKIETLQDRRAEEKATSHTTIQTNRTARRVVPKIAQTTSGVEQWRGLVAKYFPANQVNNALLVMKGESGGNPNEVNDNPKTKDYSVGLFQINLYGNLANSRPSEAWLKVPENNIRYAYGMWKDGGGSWHPWKNTARKIGL